VVYLIDESMAAAQGSFELLLPTTILDLSDLSSLCALDPRLTVHQLSVAVLFGSPPVEGTASEATARTRFVLFDLHVPATPLGTGTLLRCDLSVKADAPLGPAPLVFDRIAVADPGGGLIGNLETTAGVLLIASYPVSPTPTGTVLPSSTASATAPTTPAPSPTATPVPAACPGDCNQDGTVPVDELIQAVNIALGNSLVATCPAADRNANGIVSVDELVAAVGSALSGCPMRAR